MKEAVRRLITVSGDCVDLEQPRSEGDDRCTSNIGGEVGRLSDQEHGKEQRKRGVA